MLVAGLSKLVHVLVSMQTRKGSESRKGNRPWSSSATKATTLTVADWLKWDC